VGASFSNPKSEAPNPKQIQNSKSKCSKRPSERFLISFWILKFEFVSDFDIRASDLQVSNIQRDLGGQRSLSGREA
jgi:hypothetical protein